jgi:PTS system nitrogen regulatory IIA component
MELIDVLSPERIALDAGASSKKALLETAARLLASADDGADARVIFESLCQRERLGSTGLGGGVAIPHARVNHQTELRGCLIRLRHPVNFDAPDAQPVDTLFVLAMPNEASDSGHTLLKGAAAALRSPEVVTAIRQAQHAEDIMQLFSAGSEHAS